MRNLRRAIETFEKVFILINLNESSDEFFPKYESLYLNKGNMVEFLYQTDLSNGFIVSTIISSINEFLSEVGILFL